MYGFKSRRPLAGFSFYVMLFFMGALTSKPFTFTARSWELSDRLTYDFTDSFFSPIKVSFRGSSVMRVLPEFSQTIISEWISDRARFSYDSVNFNDQKCDNVFDQAVLLFSVSWANYFCKRFPKNFMFFLSSRYADLSAAKRLVNIVQFAGLSHVQNGFSYDFRNYCTDYLKFYKSANSFNNFFFVGFSLRYQLPVLAASLRRISQQPGNNFFNFGFFSNNLLSEINLGFRCKDLVNFSRAKSRLSRFLFKNFSNSAVVTVPQLYLLFKNNSSFLSNVFAFFDVPCALSFAEVVGLTGVQFFMRTNKFVPSIPHPFSYTTHNVRTSRYQKFDSFYSSVFYGNSTKFFTHSVKLLDFSGDFSTFAPISRVVYPHANFYTHYTDFVSADSSLNVLVAVRRQVDSRSNFNYNS